MHDRRRTQRCERHGLVVTSNGACPSCEAGSRTRGRIVRGTVVVALAVAVVVPVWRHVAEPEPISEPAPAGSSLLGPEEDRVRLDIRREARVSHRPVEGEAMPRETVQAVREDDPPNAEDRHLGRAIARPEGTPFAPPSPPRASVDPEPRAPDDPRDFELIGR